MQAETETIDQNAQAGYESYCEDANNFLDSFNVVQLIEGAITEFTTHSEEPEGKVKVLRTDNEEIRQLTLNHGALLSYPIDMLISLILSENELQDEAMLGGAVVAYHEPSLGLHGDVFPEGISFYLPAPEEFYFWKAPKDNEPQRFESALRESFLADRFMSLCRHDRGFYLTPMQFQGLMNERSFRLRDRGVAVAQRILIGEDSLPIEWKTALPRADFLEARRLADITELGRGALISALETFEGDTRKDYLAFVDKKRLLLVPNNNRSIGHIYNFDTESWDSGKIRESLFNQCKTYPSHFVIFLTSENIHDLHYVESFSLYYEDDLIEEERDQWDEWIRSGFCIRSHHWFKQSYQEIQLAPKPQEGTLDWAYRELRRKAAHEDIELLNYVQNITEAAMIVTSNWHWGEIFFNDQGFLKVREKRDINALIFQKRLPSEFLDYKKEEEKEEEKQVTKEQIESFLEQSSRRLVAESEASREAYDALNVRIQALRNELDSCTSQASAIAQRMGYTRSGDMTMADGIFEDIKALATTGVYEFLGISERGYLLFKNISPFFLKTSDGEERFNVRIGRFLFEVNPFNYKVRCKSLDLCETPTTDYKHPYLMTNDWLCFGAEESRRSKLLARRDLYDLMLLVRDLLTSFDPGNPYVSDQVFIAAHKAWERAKDIARLEGSDFSEARADFNRDMGNRELKEGFCDYYNIYIGESGDIHLGNDAYEMTGRGCHWYEHPWDDPFHAVDDYEEECEDDCYI